MRIRWLALLVVLLMASLALAWYALAPAEPALQGNPTGACARAPDDLAPDQSPDHEAHEHASSRTHADDPAGQVKPPPVKDSSPPDPDGQRGQTGDVIRDAQSPPTPQDRQEKPDTQPQETSAETAPETPQRPFIRGHERPAGQNLGNTRPPARRMVKAAGVKAPAEVTDQLKQDRRGLYAQYFDLPQGKLPESMPETPSYTRIDRQLSFPDAESFAGVPVGESFAAVWTGFLVIEQAADYWLFWGADNGGRVELAGQTVLLQDGMVRYVEVSTVLTLQPGAYPLRIEFAQYNNGVQDWRKAAANFMWVPQGESKPVPVPPEMLLLPEKFWSDHAPIITSLSKNAGEIGDEITIYGKNFRDQWPNGESRYTEGRVVTFAGQLAPIISESDTEIRVKVPIGARTGDIIVRYDIWGYDISGFDLTGGIPSNSMPFKVTTQFGLLAEWYDQSELQSAAYIDASSAVPDVARHESPPSFTSGLVDQQPHGFSRCCCRWIGQIGLPASEWLAVTFSTGQPLRVTLNGEQRSSDETQQFHWEFDSGDRYLPLVIEMLGEADQPPELSITLRVKAGTINVEGNETPVIVKRTLPANLLFPPQQPKTPPIVWAVANATPDPWKPAAVMPPPSRPSVAVGETMNVTVRLSASQLLSPVTFALDGQSMPAEFLESKDVVGGWHVTCAMTVPPGVGDGRLTATQGASTSEPFLIDIANRGLIGFYYDFPQPGGLSAVPDLAALDCFALRKDRRVNFESPADFDLPFPAETFVVEWYGGLIIETAGDYTFTGRTDDGMRLWIDGNLVIDANKPQAPAENCSAAIHLLPGVYPFRMQYFENNQHEVCVLQWRATAGAGENLAEFIPRQVIPARAFTLETHPPLPPKQATGRRTDGS
ncbi:MAG: IPT/TIG domain-containing protein [Planctomycetes bacterium]|nr:IPT/TIG domain-containing protein [Planctomycetota bacterium]